MKLGRYSLVEVVGQDCLTPPVNHFSDDVPFLTRIAKTRIREGAQGFYIVDGHYDANAQRDSYIVATFGRVLE